MDNIKLTRIHTSQIHDKMIKTYFACRICAGILNEWQVSHIKSCIIANAYQENEANQDRSIIKMSDLFQEAYDLCNQIKEEIGSTSGGPTNDTEESKNNEKVKSKTKESEISSTDASKSLPGQPLSLKLES